MADHSGNDFRRGFRLGFFLAGIAVVAALAGCQKKPAAPPNAVTVNGHTWHVELAVTDERRAEGLAHRASLPRDQGMIFVYDQVQPELNFWMKNCLIAIDIAFIGPDRRVIRTYTMYPEPDKMESELAKYPSGSPAQFALEVAGGELDRAGIKPGQQVEFSPGIEQAARKP